MITKHYVRDHYNDNKFSEVWEINRLFFTHHTRQACDALADELAQAGAHKVKDWTSTRSKRVDRIRSILRQYHLTSESRFNAAHGRSYDLCAYPSYLHTDLRRVVLAAQCGMKNTNPELSE